MPHVNTHYRVLQVAGHHRQPRSATTWIEPTAASGAEVVAGTTLTPYAPPQLAYTVDGNTQVADFVFWSASDGTDGQTTTNPVLNQTVGSTPMELTAWYLPIGGVGGTGTGWIIDAFSDALGDFVDDTFVTVTSDSSLTSEANVVGYVPTTNQEVLDATNSIHTGETFEHWIGGNAAGADDTLAAGSSGYAVATYHLNHTPIPKVTVNAQQEVIILYGIINDAPGAILGPHGPVPIDPGWGSFLGRAARAAGVSTFGAQMRGAAELQKIALADVLDATKQLQGEVEQRFEK
jgi:hypothetical protein